MIRTVMRVSETLHDVWETLHHMSQTAITVARDLVRRRSETVTMLLEIHNSVDRGHVTSESTLTYQTNVHIIDNNVVRSSRGRK